MKNKRKKIGFLMLLCFFLLAFGACDSSDTADQEDSDFSKECIEPETIPFTPSENKPSLLDFLKTAIQPVGSTMYVWGGGWNEEDTGAGIEAVTIGLSPTWAQFAQNQDSSYDYAYTYYQIHNGLDCSGYVGWAVYNTLETESGKDGYVFPSTKIASTYAQMGFGDYIPSDKMTHWKAGDIMSMDGHVWISCGTCEDGSVLILHASPPGVIFCGTTLPDGKESQAILLAELVMKTYYPDWYEKYPNCSRSYSYLTKSNAMRWNEETLQDKENLKDMTAAEVVAQLFF